MGMETTWDELRVTVLQKMHLIEGDKVVVESVVCSRRVLIRADY